VSDNTPQVETDADRAKKEAEARQADAEARAADAAAEKTAQELIVVQQLVEAQELALVETREARLVKEAGDDRQHVYRFGDQVSSASVDKCIAATTKWSRLDPACPMTVVFNSPGGSIIDGFALYDHLRDLSDNFDHHITTVVRGYAASMAGILMQAGDERHMGREAWYMIHRASFGAVGQTFDVEDRVEWVKRIEARILDIFVARTNLTKQKIKRNWNRKDWWLSSDECLEYGLVDVIR
jgi:ATP-dependent Clp endopeptidase proteolytic subunit ClpP